MRKFILQVHLYIGLIAGFFLVLLGITGSIMAFEPELDHLLHHRLSYVNAGDHTLSLAEIGRVVSIAFPADTITGYRLASSSDLSWQVELRVHRQGKPGRMYPEQKIVYVNPYTGVILGSLTRPDHWDDWLQTIHQLHLRLAMRMKGDPGKKIITWAAVGLLFLQLTGLFLWWRQKRVRIQWRKPSRRIWFDIHNVIGIVAYLFLLVLAITGLVMGFEKQTTPFFYQVTGSQPGNGPDLNVPLSTGTVILPADTAVEIARRALPGAAPFDIPLPGRGEMYVVSCRFPEDLTPGGRSMVFIDPYSGKVLYAESSRTAPAGTRIVKMNHAIHTGDLFGMPSKIVMSLASLALTLLFISGVAMCGKRKLTGR
jgi:uncharacterized iron-regulated membrane protein